MDGSRFRALRPAFQPREPDRLGKDRVDLGTRRHIGSRCGSSVDVGALGPGVAEKWSAERRRPKERRRNEAGTFLRVHAF